MGIKIAIDGPSGAGKSTISKTLAGRLGYIYVDTGALYRTVALGCMRAGADLESAEAVARCLPSLDISLTHIDGVQRVLLGGEDVSEHIRTPEISLWASKLSALPAVRAFLLDTQRAIAETRDVVMDGRDIGTVVLPDAAVKIFLTAAPGDRARRRYEEMLSKGAECDYETVLREVMERDERDRTRSASPTVKAADADMIDTTGNTFEQSVEQIYAHVKKRLL
ncbi:MAG: (d)CMP kinase [Oscillospiraceae bacterium]|nr:(d)CMP kinase [Oscillospiraceae bacterium]